jgi:hypothetical protein
MSMSRSAEAASAKPCGFPGCERPARSYSGEGRPSAYCTDPGHNKDTARWARHARQVAQLAVQAAELQRLRALLNDAGLASNPEAEVA